MYRMKKTFAVWGEGISSSEIVRGGETTHEACAVAADKGGFAREGCEGNQWVVEVTCSESDLDAQTRHDSATKGYARIPKARA